MKDEDKYIEKENAQNNNGKEKMPNQDPSFSRHSSFRDFSKNMENKEELSPNKNHQMNPNTYRKEEALANKKKQESSLKKEEASNENKKSVGNSLSSKVKQGVSNAGRKAKNVGRNLSNGYQDSLNEEENTQNTEGRQAVSNVARKAGGALKKGIKTLWRMIPLTVKIGIIIAVLILFVILFVIIYIASDSDSSGKGGYSYDYKALPKEEMDFLCSIEKPLKGYEVSGLTGWRYHPIYYYGKFHYGIDIYANTADRGIYAVADGTVIDKNTGCTVGNMDCGGGWGNYVRIKHTNGYVTVYAHMSRVLVSDGEAITTGTKIGIEGSTGASTGDHLHFEVYNEKGEYVSSNPFFDYSDEGYEHCVDPTGAYSSVCDNSMEERYMGDKAFEQICKNKRYNSNSCGSNGNIYEYLKGWEGAKYCENGQYKVYDAAGNGDITVGPGLTEASVFQSSYIAEYIRQKGYEKYFVPDGNVYRLKGVGSCYPVKIIDDIFAYSVDANYSHAVTVAEEELGYTLQQHEHDALTDWGYLYGPNVSKFKKFIEAYKSGGYKKFWEVFKKNISNSEPYKKRAKGDFALFVTGDYSDNNLFYSRGLDNYDDYDSEGVMGKVKVCNQGSGTSGNSSNLSDREKVLKIANSELQTWPEVKEQQDQKILQYLHACGLDGTVTHYCQGFVSYVLTKAGVYEKIAPPEGSRNCFADNFIFDGSSYKARGQGTYHTQNSGYIPKPGDLVFFDWDMETRIDIDHIGIVESVDEDGYIHTIEGNTNVDAAGRYDGLGRVDKRKRSTSTIRGYLEW